MMNIQGLVEKNRSYRRFYQEEMISEVILKDLINLARLSATGRNAQSLKFHFSNTVELNDKIFSTCSWAGYLKDWVGPIDGEQPSAYITILHDTQISNVHFCDEGIAAQSILLGAVEKGLGGCMIASVKKQELINHLDLMNHLEVLLVIALGKPKEEVRIVEMQDDDIKYWRDENQVHYVPKRRLEDIIVNVR